MKIFVCVNLNKPHSKQVFSNVIAQLRKFGAEILLNSETEPLCKEMGIENISFGSLENNIFACNMFMTIGGDGTILRWGKLAAKAGKPLLGVNTGRLGFMATLECNQLDKLKRLIDGEYTSSRRMFINVCLKQGSEEKNFLAMNDVVMFKSTASKLPEYVVCRDKAEVSRFRADGMIISTPTGSTAYSLSAGGPIIDPQLSCFELTALCPHTLFNRPMLFSADSKLTAYYTGYENSSVFITVDGGESIDLHEQDRVVITKSDLALELIDLSENSFYESVHGKLMRPLK